LALTSSGSTTSTSTFSFITFGGFKIRSIKKFADLTGISLIVSITF